MPVGVGEILLLAVLAFVAFGPRRRGAVVAASPLEHVTLVGAVLAPAMIFVERAAAAEGVVGAGRWWLVAASVGATVTTLVVLRAVERFRSGAKDLGSAAAQVAQGTRNAVQSVAAELRKPK